MRFPSLRVFWPLLLTRICCADVSAKELYIGKFDTTESIGGWTGGRLDKDGVINSSIRIQEPDIAVMKQEFPFVAEEGAVEFWIKTGWPGNDGLLHRILSFGNKSEIAVVKDTNDEMLFLWMPAAEKAQPMKIGFETKRVWPEGIWRHLVFTWQRTGDFRIFLDGDNITSGKPAAPPALVVDSMPLALGGKGTSNGEMWIDEVRIHDTVPSRQQVLASFLRGKESQEKRTQNARLTLFASLGGRPGSFFLGTGSKLNMVFSSFATDAELDVFDHKRSGRLQKETNALFNIQGCEERLRFVLIDNDAEFTQSGMLGWMQFFAANRLLVDWDRRSVRLSPSGAQPDQAEGWWSIPIEAAEDRLVLKPQKLGVGDFEVTLPVIIDTGTSWGISLSTKTWASLRSATKDCPEFAARSWTEHLGFVDHVRIVPESVELFGITMQGISISESL